MITLSRTSGICIPRKYESYEFYSKIKKFLTRHTKEYQTSVYITNYYYLEGTNVLKIPRFFPVQDYIKEDFEIIDNLPDGQDININHHIELRDEVQQNIVKYYLSNVNGIIQANPGSGKTIVSVYAVATLKKKTFILVHRDTLVDQWIGPGTKEKPQGFLAFSDLDKDQIGRLSSQNYKDVLNKSVIVCTDQTFGSLLKRDRVEFLTELNNANIGMLIGDEVHTTVGAPTYAECSLHTPVRKAFGLSATPKRWDGNLDIMKCHLGEIYIPEGKSSEMDASITILLFNSGLLPKSHYYLYYGGFFQKGRYLTILKNSKIFMGICDSLIKKFCNDGRKIVFVGERIKLFEILIKKCNSCPTKSIFKAGSKIELIEDDLTYTTPNKSRDGVDYVSKDCAIVSSPVGNIEQMLGRVLRPAPGKKQPLGIDMVDIGIKDIRETAFPRLEFYKRKGWEIKYLFVASNGSKRFLTEDEAINIIRGN
jgi:superfamily II DNA or RNA helicase